MGLLRWLGLGAPPASAPGIAAVADAVSANLRALGLFVDARAWGAHFVEIRASTVSPIVTTPGDEKASGVALLLAGKFDPPALVFEQINSLTPGLGGRMVGAALAGAAAAPGLFRVVRVNDLSPFRPDGKRWWEHMAARHAAFDWRITHDPDDAHWPQAARGGAADVTRTPDFERKRAALARLARDFGHDPESVTLSPETKTFDYLGQRFTSEGEATPDGRVTIYYDPAMSEARLGCCLAHELQHIRYFAVAAAWRADAPDGPLRRRFARFTPEALAARRGVSNYSNEHWDTWRGTRPPALFSDELADGGAEPVNETIAEVAKALYNWGDAAKVDPLWRELKDEIDAAWRALRGR
jgi:hypothetical protein